MLAFRRSTMSVVTNAWFENYDTIFVGMKRDSEGVARQSAVYDQLNSLGFATVCIEIESTSEFLKEIDDGSTRWLQGGIRMALSALNNANLKPELVVSRDAWNMLSLDEQQSIIMNVRLVSDDDRASVFNKQAPYHNAPWGAFFSHAIRYAKQGQSNMTLGTIERAWTNAGFGIWAQVVPDIGLKMMIELGEELRKQGLQVVSASHLPHIIYKPPGGEALKSHHDRMSTRQLIDNLKSHVQAGGEAASTASWVNKYGFQALAHMAGGRNDASGGTFTYSPMSPAALLQIIRYFIDDNAHTYLTAEDLEKVDSWLKKDSGPYFLDIDKHIKSINKRLVDMNFSPIKKTVIAPCTMLDPHGDPFVALWPVGFPHGSTKNKVRRVTVTVPLQVVGILSGSTPPVEARLAPRLYALANLAHSNEQDQVESALRVLTSPDQQRPFNDGKTHKNPRVAIELFRGVTAAAFSNAPVGPFWKIAPRMQTAQSFIEHFGLLSNSGAGPSSSTPPNAPLLNEGEGSSDIRVLAVRQPWAYAIVNGIKDVENRKSSMISPATLPRWVLISSSKGGYTRAEFMTQYNDMNDRASGSGIAIPPVHSNTFMKGYIVGMAKLVSIQDESSSIWFNRGDIAHVFGDSISFSNPIEFHRGQTAMVKLKGGLASVLPLVTKEVVRNYIDNVLASQYDCSIEQNWEAQYDAHKIGEGWILPSSMTNKILEFLGRLQYKADCVFDEHLVRQLVIMPLGLS